MKNIKSVLFVCTGNSCRSIMAEGLLKKYLKEAGRTDIEVSSSGILPLEGLKPTAETIQVMKDEGVDVSSYKSRPLTAEIIKKADLILVMEELHRQEVMNSVPDAGSRTCLLRGYYNCASKAVNNIALGVRDPIGRSMEDYKASKEMIKKEIERIVKLL